MELKKYDVAVVGSFYNISWVASELARQGWSVLYIDLHSVLGRWPMEDIEGPFGFFTSETLNPFYVEKLNNEEALVSQDSGFTVYLGSGPLEFKSSFIQYQLQQLGVSSGFISRLESSTENFYQASQKSDEFISHFEKSWLEFLTRSLSSQRDVAFGDPVVCEYPLPLMNPFFTRFLTRRSLERNSQWLRRQNIDTFEQTHILDFAVGASKGISGFEAKGELNGIVQFKNLVWGLSSEETYYCRPQLGKILFPKGVTEPIWTWARYSVDVTLDRETKQLPLHSVWIDDRNAPWTHENLLIWQRTTSETLYDVWILIPNNQRFNKDYITYYGEKIVQKWSKRFEMSAAKIHNYPQEYVYTYQDLGPSRWVRYPHRHQRGMESKEYNNVYFNNYEVWDQLNKETQYQSQKKLIDKVTDKLKKETTKELR
ncbi:MAG: hypothetical protein JNL11_16210 [Bdellovibrionaceae bacterium]|nr:hypothetical protein [Pseudobdellovibrionaceae bacterium]